MGDHTETIRELVYEITRLERMILRIESMVEKIDRESYDYSKFLEDNAKFHKKADKRKIKNA